MDTEKLRADYTADCEAIETVARTWEDKENLLIGRVNDRLSKNFKSRVSDGRLATLAWDSASRVMAQLPTGSVKVTSTRDKGKAMLLDIILQRYVFPKANWEMPLLIKLRMWNLYSKVYGVMPMLYDWVVRDDYIGPDCHLIPMHNFTPQRGKVTIQDSDYVWIDNYVSASWLEAQIKDKKTTWNKKDVQDVVKMAEAGDKPKNEHKKSQIERTRADFIGQQSGSNAQIRLTTRYEKGTDGHWVTFAPDYGWVVLRDIENPHASGRIPVVLKHSLPLIDSMFGLGDFERGKPVQMAMDALVNLYLDAVKMSVYPPMIINPNGIVPHTIKYGPGQKWLETLPNSIRRFESSPQGLNTFQSTYQFLTGALLNQAGTSDTMQTTDGTNDPSFGKTPQALQMLQQREMSRDNWDRFMQEQAIEELYDGFIQLILCKQQTPIELDIFGDEIQAIQDAGFEDVKDMLQISDSKQYAKLTVKGDFFKGTSAKYYVDPGTTREKDQSEQNDALSNLLVLFSKVPNLDQALQAQGYQVDFGAVIRGIVNSSGVDNPDQIITKTPVQSGATAVGQSSDAMGIPNAGQAQAQAPGIPVHFSASLDKLPPQDEAAILAANNLPVPSNGGSAAPAAPSSAGYVDPHVAAVAAKMFGR